MGAIILPETTGQMGAARRAHRAVPHAPGPVFHPRFEGLLLTPLHRLQSLLRDLLQLDLSDLDFGIYRLLRVKRTEMEAFLEEQLPAAVADAFGATESAERAGLERKLEELARRIRSEVAEDALDAAGAVADEYQDVKVAAARELLSAYEDTRLSLAAVRTSDEQRIEVFNHLHEFFRRYYQDGDFVPRRHYGRRERYAVPYDGEEVLLHWANRGQHYVKNAEVFKDYAFTVEGDLLAEPARVRFVLTEADVSPGDTKGDSRYFFPRPDEVAWDAEARSLTVPFEYRLPTREEDAGFGRVRIQETILDDQLEALVEAIPDGAVRAALLPEREDDEGGEPAPLEKHLRRFVRRNTSDYFVHPDLQGFLEQELEFYLKDQVLHLADLDGDTAARLRMIRVLRQVAGQVIAFLGQMEDVQKRLFEKRKFVLRTDYLVLMKAVPEELRAEVLASQEQIDEWRRLFHIDPVQDLFNPEGAVNEAFLESRPTLVVNTALFGDDFRDRLLESFEDIEEATGGILVHSENYQALRLLEPRFRGQIKCIYIDPPYNTGSDDFLYKDRYQHSSWLAMMEERLRLGREMLTEDGVCFSAIDEKELQRLRTLMDQAFGPNNHLGDVVWHNATDNNPTRIAVEHEYVLVYARDKDSLEKEWKSKHSHAKQLLLSEYRRLKSQALTLDEIEGRFRQFIKDNKATIGKLQRYKFLDDEGPYTGSESVHNPHPGGYDYELFHPDTGNPMNKPANGYRFPEETMRNEYLEKGRLIFGSDENRIVKIKVYLAEYQEAFRSVVRLDSRLGAYALRELFGRGRRVFTNPKAVELIERLVSFSSGHRDTVLDFLAGSGTTAEAVLRLRRSEGHARSFILVEMADHFDSIILPRVKRLLYARTWRDGRPIEVCAEADSPSLTKILRLESYEDALHNLASEETLRRESPRADAHRAAQGEDRYRLHYLASLPLEASDSMLNVEKLEHPFRYEMEVLTEEGPERRTLDLVETFNLILGLRVRRVERWVDDNDGSGRTYRAVVGEDPEGQRTLILWRDMEALDADLEREFLETRIAEADGAPFDLVLINGDSTVPDVRSLDPLFKAGLEAGTT